MTVDEELLQLYAEAVAGLRTGIPKALDDRFGDRWSSPENRAEIHAWARTFIESEIAKLDVLLLKARLQARRPR